MLYISYLGIKFYYGTTIPFGKPVKIIWKECFKKALAKSVLEQLTSVDSQNSLSTGHYYVTTSSAAEIFPHYIQILAGR